LSLSCQTWCGTYWFGCQGAGLGYLTVTRSTVEHMLNLPKHKQTAVPYIHV